jgi:hypothetical protein
MTSNSFAHFVNCVRHGKPTEEPFSGKMNVEVMEILDTAQKSVRTGGRKNYDEIPENATHGQVSPRIFSITVKRDCPVRSI